MKHDEQSAYERLNAAGLFFDDRDSINLTHVWARWKSDSEDVPSDQLLELDRLHQAYGWCGVLYWVSERRGKCRSEFADVNRRIDFVRKEEEIIKDIPRDSERAYTKRIYVIGEV